MLLLICPDPNLELFTYFPLPVINPLKNIRVLLPDDLPVSVLQIIDISLTTFLLILLLPVFIEFSFLPLVLQVSTTPAPLYLPSVSVPLCLEEEARDLVPQVNSNAWDQPPTHLGTLPLSACLPPPPLPANILLLIDWPSHTGREPQ